MVIARALSALGFGGKPDLRPDVPMQARPAETLEQHIMDVNIAKSDAEWWARHEIEALRADLSIRDRVIGDLNGMVDDYRPDALKWRDSLKRSRDRKSARKGAVS